MDYPRILAKQAKYEAMHAIKVFPKSNVIVEGYTDSFGGDASNLKLSQSRSDAVMQYLIANASMRKSGMF